MVDREKVIKGLECKLNQSCAQCPYDEDFNCIGCDVLFRDALALLKAQELVLSVPAVDAVPVVRCKDCKHWNEDIDANTKWLMCHEIVTDRNWFCADGERREAR